MSYHAQPNLILITSQLSSETGSTTIYEKMNKDSSDEVSEDPYYSGMQRSLNVVYFKCKFLYVCLTEEKKRKRT